MIFEVLIILKLLKYVFYNMFCTNSKWILPTKKTPKIEKGITVIIHAFSEGSSRILLLPLSVRPISLHLKLWQNHNLGSDWACLADAQ